MLSSSVTTKGQVTIPAELRARLGIQPGDRVGFTEDEGRLVLQRQETAITSVFGLVKAKHGVDLELMNTTTASGWKRRAGT
ncbi:MAG: AbrB/MazE/SpoVT family DNA-binding domain-containing protein [Rhodocyclaceae bacterium]|nr:AbrB/MazE/SpoVT family DNA-binding domain-containing protein [Rhodocyclaceae bacterium]MDZ4216092.1 AbrB/MazE/SpoVT family DNA-binding domain-containing protein [Rhodocyclaceae bacterium]